MKKPVISILSALTGVAIGIGVVNRKAVEKAEKNKVMSDKHLALFLMMNQWVKVKQEGKNLASYLERNGYRKIAVYGMSYAGETLLDELKGTGIQVAYGIDKNADAMYARIDIVSAEDDILDEVDAIVVTAVTFFPEIEEKLSKKVSCPIISLEDILYAV